MPKLTDSLPKYRRHKPSGQAVVTLSGRDHYLGPYRSKASRVEYDRLIGEWLACGRQPLLVDAGDLFVSELLARYWQYAKGYYAGSDGTGELASIRAATRVLKSLYGKTLAVEFGPLALKAVRAKMVDAGWARLTVNRNVSRIRRVFKWGVAEQLIPPSVLQSLQAVDGLRRGKTTAPETNPVEPVDDAAIDATLLQLPDVVADMVRLQRFTGARPSEICALKPGDIDRSGEVWEAVLSDHKTAVHGKQRTIYIGPQGQSVLLRYLARNADMFCFRPCDSEAKRLAERHANRETPLSCGTLPGTNRQRNPKRKPGERYSTDAYRRAIHRACQRAGIEKWSPNQLRHTAATKIRREYGLDVAQCLLGHSQLSTTQIYAELDREKAQAVVKQIG